MTPLHVDRSGCPHCDPEHGDPAVKTWGVFVAADRDGDGQPTHLYVSPSDGAHVAESDAVWLRDMLRRYSQPEVAARNELLVRVLADLDRCLHGRHEGDSCFDCPGGRSAGNPLMPAGERIGTTYTGRPIVMPTRERRRDPDAWYPQGRR